MSDGKPDCRRFVCVCGDVAEDQVQTMPSGVLYHVPPGWDPEMCGPVVELEAES